MVAQMSTLLAEQSINVIDLLNKSRDEIAYTLIDTDQAPSAELLNAMQAIEGVVRVRSL